MNDWHEELRVAGNWWKGPIKAAIEKAYPPTTLFTFLASEVSRESNLERFVEEFILAVGNDFTRRKVPWNRSVPLDGHMLRKVGIEGAFRAEPLRIALAVCGLDEVAPFLPDGCLTVISPGKVFAISSRRERETVIEVPLAKTPPHLEGVSGYGI
jgi:hypothetical protein